MTSGGGGSTGPPLRRRGPGDNNDNVNHPDDDDDADDDDDDDDDNGGVEGGSGIDYGSIVSLLRDGTFGMHSDRPLLGLWRFLTRQRKQRAFFRNAARHSDGRYGGENATSDVVSSMSSSQQSKDGGNFDQYNWSRLFEDPSLPLVVNVGCGMGVSLLGLQPIYGSIGGGATSSAWTSVVSPWGTRRACGRGRAWVGAWRSWSTRRRIA